MYIHLGQPLETRSAGFLLQRRGATATPYPKCVIKCKTNTNYGFSTFIYINVRMAKMIEVFGIGCLVLVPSAHTGSNAGWMIWRYDDYWFSFIDFLLFMARFRRLSGVRFSFIRQVEGFFRVGGDVIRPLCVVAAVFELPPPSPSLSSVSRSPPHRKRPIEPPRFPLSIEPFRARFGAVLCILRLAWGACLELPECSWYFVVIDCLALEVVVWCCSGDCCCISVESRC